jgi:hypothetical protein
MPKPIGEGLEEPFSVITHTRPGVVPWRLVVRQPDEDRFSLRRFRKELPDWLATRFSTTADIDMNTGLVMQHKVTT